MNKYDLIVIGAGPGGYLAAELAGKNGLKCLIIEKKNLGGVCLNEGCIPTKSLLYSAKAYSNSKQGFDQNAVIDSKDKTVETLVNGVASALRKNKVKVIFGNASIIGKEQNGYVIEVSGETIICDKLIIATGSQPLIPNIDGLGEALEKGYAVTSKELLDLREVPKKLCVIGGGVVGLEMAAYYNAAGSQVCVVEMMDKVGGNMDEEISELLKNNLEKQGIEFHINSCVKKVGSKDVVFEKGKKEQEVICDKVLVSVGRKASSIDGLENIGVQIERGNICIDDHCETNVCGVYAIGDVTGEFMLAHVAYRHAEIAVNHIIGLEDKKDYSAVPSVVYTKPEVAWAGLTEKQAKDKGYSYTVKKISVNASGRHVAENGLSDGICKLIVDKDKDIILGGGMIGTYSSEIISVLVLAIQNKIPIQAVSKVIFPHPTVSEVIKEVLR